MTQKNMGWRPPGEGEYYGRDDKENVGWRPPGEESIMGGMTKKMWDGGLQARRVLWEG